MKRVRKALAVALTALMAAMSGMPANAVMVNQFTDVSPTAWLCRGGGLGGPGRHLQGDRREHLQPGDGNDPSHVRDRPRQDGGGIACSH